MWIATVRHTGTGFLIKNMESLGYREMVIHWNCIIPRNKSGSKQFIHSHIEVNNKLIGGRIVMTLRNPVEVFRSHVYRYQWPNDRFEPHILNAFEKWKEVRAQYNAHVFRIDSSTPQTEVNKLAKWLDVQECKKQEPTKSRRTKPCEKNLYMNVPNSIHELANGCGYA